MRKLTARNVLTLPAGKGGARALYRDTVLTGLELRVSASGSRVYRVRYGREGNKAVNLGDARVVALADARDKARAILGRVAAGEDPAGERAQARATRAASADNVEALARRLVTEAELADSTRRSWLWILDRHIFPKLGGRAPGEVTRGDVRDLLAGVESKTVSNDVFKVLRWVYARAVEADLVPFSPCAGLRKPGKERPRDRTLTRAELRALWLAAGEAGPYGVAVRFALLTGQRRGEVFGMRRAEVDLDARVWRIPAARAKSRRAHDVPLVADVLDVLAEPLASSGDDGRVFPIAPTSKAWRRLLVAAGLLDGAAETAAPPAGRRAWAALPMRFHDLRRTLRDVLTRDLGVNVAVAEAVLGHAAPRLIATYAPSGVPLADVRRALDKWARHVRVIVTGEDSARVVAGAFGSAK